MKNFCFLIIIFLCAQFAHAQEEGTVQVSTTTLPDNTAGGGLRSTITFTRDNENLKISIKIRYIMANGIPSNPILEFSNGYTSSGISSWESTIEQKEDYTHRTLSFDVPISSCRGKDVVKFGIQGIGIVDFNLLSEEDNGNGSPKQRARDFNRKLPK